MSPRQLALHLLHRIPQRRFAAWAVLFLCAGWFLSASVLPAFETRRDSAISLTAPRVVVLKHKRLLYLFDGEVLVRTYPIDLGFSPAGPKRRQGDGRTPEGRFRVVSKNSDSPYRRFLGIDYPDEAAIEAGLRLGLISPGEAASLRRSLGRGFRPDWGTALGGGIGIHGAGREADWTAGCIALRDSHVEELFSVLRIGDSVEILP